MENNIPKSKRGASKHLLKTPGVCFADTRHTLDKVADQAHTVTRETAQLPHWLN